MAAERRERLLRALEKIQSGEGTLVNELLRSALDWPIPADMELEDITYDWTEDLAHLGLEDSDGPLEVLQIPPFPGWPMGIFLIKFGSEAVFTRGRGMVTPLRTLLRQLVQKQRQTANHATFAQDQLLFICHHDSSYFQFARFKPAEDSSLPKLQTFGWGPGSGLRTLIDHNLVPLAYNPEATEQTVQAVIASAFDVSKVSNQFYEDYTETFKRLRASVADIIHENFPAHEFSQLIMNRLMLIRFLEQKGWLSHSGKDAYLSNLFHEATTAGESVAATRLRPLFFAGLGGVGATNDNVIGTVPFLGGTIFEEHDIDVALDEIPNEIMSDLIGPEGIFYRFNFTIRESTPFDEEVAIDPEMLGTMFEKLVTSRGESGSFYTPRQVVSYMCREAIKSTLSSQSASINFNEIRILVDESDVELLSEENARILHSILSEFTVIDPACGSGAYLLGMLQELVRVNTLLQSKIPGIHESIFDLKYRVISRSIFGVDYLKTATNITMLRLWLSLIIESNEPVALPNLDFNIEHGDSLLSPDPTAFTWDATGAISRADSLIEIKAKYLQSTGEHALSLRDEILHELDEIRKLVDKENAFQGSVDYRVQFAEVFAKHGGFHCVLANPPYVKHQKIDKKLKPKIKSKFVRKGGPITASSDLYCYFFVRAMELLRTGGIQVFITSNTWLDSQFGASLQSWFLRNFTVETLIDSAKEKQFSSAEINTVISFITKTPPNKGHAIEFKLLLGEFTESVNSAANQRLRCVSSTELDLFGRDLKNEYVGSKWSSRLRAPDYYWDFLRKYSPKLRPLGSYGIIRTGIKTGCDGFFVIENERAAQLGIEEEFLVPLLRKSADCMGTVTTEESSMAFQFSCSKSKSQLKGTKALDYITWGENEGFHEWAKPRSQNPWYWLGAQNIPPIILPRSMNQIHRSYLNEANLSPNFRLSGFWPFEIDERTMAALLQSTLFSFMLEFGSRGGLGMGLIDLMNYEIGQILVPDVDSEFELKPIQREIKTLDFELHSEDRIALDQAILSFLGCPDGELEKLYQAYRESVEIRISKARS